MRYRVALLCPTVQGKGPGSAMHLADTLAAVLVVRHLQAHPQLSPLDCEEAGFHRPSRPPRSQDANAAHYLDQQLRQLRRDQVIDLEISSTAARLSAHSRLGKPTDWSASTGSLSTQVSSIVNQWLHSRGLAPLPALDDFSYSQFVSASEAIALALVQNSSEGRVETWPALQTAASLTLELHTAPLSGARAAPNASSDKARRRVVQSMLHRASSYASHYLQEAEDTEENTQPDHPEDAQPQPPDDEVAYLSYAARLAKEGRSEEARRWTERALVISPRSAAAHLCCAAAAASSPRLPEAYAESELQRRALDATRSADRLVATEMKLLCVETHVATGQLDTALQLLEQAAGASPKSMVRSRLEELKKDPNVLANCFAREGFFAGDPGRAVHGFSLGVLETQHDLTMYLESLISLGREELALIAFTDYQHRDPSRFPGDGRARLAGAKAHILCGDLSEAMEQLLIVSMRSAQSRLDSEVNHVLRLAATRRANEWDDVLRKWLSVGALQVARMAARDLGDFVPDLSRSLVQAALGRPTGIAMDNDAVSRFAEALGASASVAPAIRRRLTKPRDNSLESADQLAQEWWTSLVPPSKDLTEHAASALFAYGLALGRYLEASSHDPTPIAGGYRQVATQALQLVRQARDQIQDEAIVGLFSFLEEFSRCPEWLLDTWVLRTERELDLVRRWGATTAVRLAAAPTIASLLRGDVRIGEELEQAAIAAGTGATTEAQRLYQRCHRAMEGGAGSCEWSRIAIALESSSEALDALWTCALASRDAEPWQHLATALFRSGRNSDGLTVACRAQRLKSGTDPTDRLMAMQAAWPASLEVPFDPREAHPTALRLGSKVDVAQSNLRWAAAWSPSSTTIAKEVATAYSKSARPYTLVGQLAAAYEDECATVAGRLLVAQGRFTEAVQAYCYASYRFQGEARWRELATAAFAAEENEIAVGAFRYCIESGANDPELLASYADALCRIGRWAEAATAAARVIEKASGSLRAQGLHALATALAGQGLFDEAQPYAREAVALRPSSNDFAETLQCIEGGHSPIFAPGPESSIERKVFDALASGDPVTPERTAMYANSWGLARGALAATELKRSNEISLAISGRALEAALKMLDRSVGTLLPDAALCRIRALRIREAAFIQFEPVVPVDQRLPRVEFEERWAQRVANYDHTGPVRMVPLS
jgi:tetratricopeptide (TPR) repeat protein